MFLQIELQSLVGLWSGVVFVPTIVVEVIEGDDETIIFWFCGLVFIAGAIVLIIGNTNGVVIGLFTAATFIVVFKKIVGFFDLEVVPAT
jgi:hypothetical protein